MPRPQMIPDATPPGAPTRGATDERLMREALALAADAGRLGEVPVGALIVREGTVVARAANATRARGAVAHAELLAIERAHTALGAERLDGCTLYATLEPCAMCAGAIVLARLDRVVFGAWDDKAGMAGSVGDILRHASLNHMPEVQGGVLATDAGDLLRRFFAARREA